ncbi:MULTISPECIES: WXG100 family type VII secretion target [Bacillus cereus group]|uniref:WXG100 family type VII secretion target n=1 Tax=Bacillus cereus group TaxID=86661 RepID=UPI001BB30073|nr:MULTISPECIES: WXG100 family type VII secretion target [Bacillus cereus group]MDQ4481820.1 WXG100 family type VII secretion target [Bacillus cereus]MEB9455492.1 WXG100 family type VII secretion target [Bacillus anthracis]QUW28578.1 WXG100 family type VII secretion target [Bacillus cereus]
MEIKVKPEQLEQIAKNISEMQTHSQNIQQNLNQSMFSIQMQWQGATSQHFYGEYMRSMRLMESYIRNLQVTEKELRRIAQKFRQADEEYQKKQNEKLKEAHKKEKKNEKSWWEKGIEGAAEFIGVNDAIRAVTGKDPITGKELSTKERLIAAGWTLLNFVPVGKVASLAGKGIKYVASSFGKTIVKAGKKLGEGVTMVAGKAGKAAVDGIKTASHKVKEGVNFVASTAKGFADKIGSLWNKGATTVKTTFLQGNEKIQHAVKTLMEYKWIPGEGKGFAMAGVGNVSGGGQYSLKEAYQYVESRVVKGTGKKDTLEVKFTKEQLATKPSYSPVPEKWMKKGGTVKIDEDGTWVYTNKKGQTVRYPDGYPDFTEYAHPTVKPVEIEIASPTNRPSDYKNANIEAGLNKNSDPPVPALDKPPVGYIWHHHQDGKTMILVDKDIHREFTHAGGVSTVNGK